MLRGCFAEKWTGEEDGILKKEYYLEILKQQFKKISQNVKNCLQLVTKMDPDIVTQWFKKTSTEVTSENPDLNP